MQLNKEQVEAFLPHRDPFLFIDSVSQINLADDLKGEKMIVSVKDLVGGSVTAHFHVSPGMDLFKGHFPGNPVLPGVIQVEMMAQAACMLIARSAEDLNNPNLVVALMGVSNAKFRHPVGPEEDLTIHTTCQKVRGPVMSYQASVESNGKIVSQADILASVKINNE